METWGRYFGEAKRSAPSATLSVAGETRYVPGVVVEPGAFRLLVSPMTSRIMRRYWPSILVPCCGSRQCCTVVIRSQIASTVPFP